MNRRSPLGTVLGIALVLAGGCKPAAAQIAPGDTHVTAPRATPSAECYPFDAPSTASLRASSKKVFAYYFPPYPVSIENRSPNQDYYNQWTDPAGGSGEYADTGGALRDRPLARPARAEGNWRQLDFQWEIRQAVAAGLDGFILEVYPHAEHPSDQRWNQAKTMLAAAKAVDPGFKIVLAPTAGSASAPKLAAAIRPLAAHPSVHRLPDGRVPILSFYPEKQPLSYWQTFRSRLHSTGVPNAFMPIFLSRTSMNGLGDLNAWFEEADGYSIWDGNTAAGAESNAAEAAEARKRGLLWVARAKYQDTRIRKGPKVELRHWEPSNSQTLRGYFEQAIAGDAPWMSVVTWNDYAESPVAPSDGRGYAVLDLIAYYTTWFKTGEQPAVIRDGLYYVHRSQLAGAPYDKGKQTAGAMKIAAGPGAEDYVEMLAFLTEPGTVIVRQGNEVATRDVGAGLSALRVPMVAGAAPKLELWRDGKLVESLTSARQILGRVTYQDMTYYAGGSIECGRPAP